MVLYVIDLFCGAGGFSTGAKQAGAKIAIAIDTWDIALDVHKQNHPTTKHLNIELGRNVKKTTEFIFSHLPLMKKNDRIHIHASPPCQQLSTINGRRNEEDGLKMVKWVIKFCKQSCFDSYTIEQVNNKHVRDLYTKLNIPFIVCDFSKLGVCQSRCRLIASNHYLLLEKLKKIDIPFEPLHKIVGKPIEYTSYWYNSVEHKKKYDKTMPFYTTISSFHQYKIYCKNNHVHGLDVDIASKLQGFPNNYFKTSKTIAKRNLCQMIANAVPTQVGFIIVYILLDKI
jgi:site-specific DNA-cytosine methylase